MEQPYHFCGLWMEGIGVVGEVDGGARARGSGHGG